jgi:CRISPR-associated protein Cmr3
MRTFDFRPADTLFCRDARPISAGNSYGRGGNWPLPTVLHGALRTALLRKADCLPKGRERDKTLRGGHSPGKMGTAAFDWLHVHGPFPVRTDGEVFFPMPADLLRTTDDGVDYLKLLPRQKGADDLGWGFLEYVPARFSKPSKEAPPEWVSGSLLKKYLQGLDIEVPAFELWSREHRIGVAIDDASHTALEGKLYGTEHLRLRDDIALRFRVADRPSHRAPNGEEDGLTPDALADSLLQLGGEQRFGSIRPAQSELRFPFAATDGVNVKWLLLTPAVFSQGWLPGWIGGDGAVRLRVIDKEARREFRRRRRQSDWKYQEENDVADTIGARLVAACLGKPRVMSGWDLLQGRDGEPKPTSLAVPAGAVYYFLADNEAEAEKLRSVLQGRCRSDCFGEKGLGLGVCGSWESQLAKDFEISNRTGRIQNA